MVSGSDPFIGRTIGDYEIVARVGGGSMGVVYRARHVRLNHMRALKFLEPRLSHDESAQERFRREAEAASSTDHPNVCTIYDLERTSDGQLFVVMAFYEGPTLKERLASGALSVDEALTIATEIADGLGAAHAKGVVHRDVKPGNVMLTEHGARIVDFGLATFVDALDLTGQASPVGTLAYMSPEQVSGGTVDARSDVWAVGVVLYEMLTGRRPFEGDAEGVSRAIRSGTPTPLREVRADVPEAVEQLVFRALLRDPALRFQSGRELGRALREARGLTLPIQVPASVAMPLVTRPRRRGWSRPLLAGIMVVVLLAGTAASLVLWPPVRQLVAIAPVINRTGYAELEPYRWGMTQALIAALEASDVARAVGHDSLSTSLQGVLDNGRDAASGEALQALRARTGATLIVTTTLINEGSGFRARVQFQQADTATVVGETYETPAEVSALPKQSALRLMPFVVEAVDARVAATAPTRLVWAHRLRRALGLAEPLAMPARTLDALASMERGLKAVEDLEYGSALEAFERASTEDTLNATATAWRSRVARIMRRDAEAARLAREARNLLTGDTPWRERVFVEAVAAESGGDVATAEARYVAVQRARPDDVGARMELAAFFDRQGRNAEAIAGYHGVLAIDASLLRPRLELCRLYNRLNQPTEAREQARRSVEGFTAVGAKSGHAQARMCLTDSLRVGTDTERAQAGTEATMALDLVRRLGQAYNLPRAYNYVALAKESQGDLGEAAALWEQALTAAKTGSNAVVEPLVLMNLGATYEKLGRAAQAVDLFRRSAAGFEALGDQARAAENQFNVGVMLITYGGDSREGLRNIQNALEVFRKLGNRNFEVRAAHAMSTYYRQTGRFAEAERELNKAVSLASERDQSFRSVTTSIRQAQVWLDTGQYERARVDLEQARTTATGRNGLEVRIHLARTLIRLGDFAGAETLLGAIGREVRPDRDGGVLPLLYAVQGEWAYEVGRFDEARSRFGAGAALLSADLPDADALQSKAMAAALDARGGRMQRAAAELTAARELAARAGHLSLEALAGVLSAALDVERGVYDRALVALDGIPPDTEGRTIAREILALALHWAGRAHAGRGEAGPAEVSRLAARQIVRTMADRMPESSRKAFSARAGIAAIGM